MSKLGQSSEEASVCKKHLFESADRRLDVSNNVVFSGITLQAMIVLTESLTNSTCVNHLSSSSGSSGSEVITRICCCSRRSRKHRWFSAVAVR